MSDEHRMCNRAAAVVGTAIGIHVTVHELEKHGDRRCMELRKDVVAFMAHALHIRPSELGEVKRMMLDHLKEGCRCGDGRELET